jgi:hypothetical protein
MINACLADIELIYRVKKIRSIIIAGDMISAYGEQYKVIEMGETVLTTGGIFYRTEIVKV